MDVVPVSQSYFHVVVFYPLVASVVILLAAYLYIESFRRVKLAHKLPGPKTVPIVGNGLITLGLDPKDVFNTLMSYDNYGTVIRALLGNKVVIFLYHPRDIEMILGSTVHIDKSPDYRYFQPWLGDGLLISNGEKWRSHRKIIAPTFHLNVLKSFVPLFYQNSMDVVENLHKYEGKEFNCYNYFSMVTVNILLETAMGLKRSDKKDSYDYAMAVMKMCDIIHQRQYSMFLRFDPLFNLSNFAKEQKDMLDIIHGLTGNVIHTRLSEVEKQQPDDTEAKNSAQPKETAKKVEQNKATQKDSLNSMHYVRDDLDDIDDNDVGEKKRLAFLDRMLELCRNGEQVSIDDVKEEVNTILFEGHDTTAAASSFALCLLGIHQDVQESVYEELEEIFKGSDRPCTFQDTVEMKYLERVILETLRLFPPVPAIARQLKHDVELVTMKGIVPKDSTVLLPIFKTHRLDEFYPDPDTFNPDNFLPDRMQARPYYAFIPFSAGPRSCVGRKFAILELKVLLSTVLRNYRIVTDHTEKDFQLKVDIILKRVDGFNIKVEPRNKSN